ncbi:aminopeptidase [Wenzhouxiangella marina]|uniref:Putative aminopeptidase n=1 Tax=Wenzhouxiangella marina TaxID=1579979 RepID=A0A0K0XZ99_9GAMM|nr:aminopeptidase [Wenzhouxiangella marina]AKS42946.1 Putative aminopeptidase [Wenzhouxiangella marina]MBB6087370.1 putative aminopeptidase [Wenzhouxiangella marina]
MLVLALGVVATGCATLAWYGQAVRGQLDLLSRREHIADLIADPATDPALVRQLETVLAARAFARDELALPEGRSYRHYADLDRPAAVWNVIAAPRYSVQPKAWCYPIAGCVAYRGYFDPEAARAAAEALRDEGFDVIVSPAVAYSTLGWFADPVLNTMIDWPSADLVGFLFHELAHERVYAKGDTAFNEAYASLVEREGVRRWLAAHGNDGELARWQAGRRLRQALSDRLLAARSRLAEGYARLEDEDELAAFKHGEFERLAADIGELAEQQGGAALEAWRSRELNNADLALTATYEAGVAAFVGLLEDCRGELDCLHREVARLAEAKPAERRAFLQAGGPQ